MLDFQEVTEFACQHNERSVIGVQVCRSGSATNVACTIRVRYVPPGHTCAIVDTKGTVVEKTVHATFVAEPAGSQASRPRGFRPG